MTLRSCARKDSEIANLGAAGSLTTNKPPELQRVLSDHVFQNFAKDDKLSFSIAHWFEPIQGTMANFVATQDDIGVTSRSS